MHEGIVRLATSRGTSSLFAVEFVQHADAILLRHLDSGGNLRINARGAVDHNGGRGVWAQFEYHQPTEVTNGFTLQSIGHQVKGGMSLFLAMSDGSLVASTEPHVFWLVGDGPVPAPLAPAIVLTPSQISEFRTRGVLLLKGLVGPQLVSEALRSINMSLAEGPDMDAARRSPQVLGLLHDSAEFRSVVAQLLGPAAPLPPGCQVALRFPNHRNDPSEEQWHIDGMQKPHLSPFNLLAGVALSAQLDDNMGNLAVWPGTHGLVHTAVHRARERAGVLMHAPDGDEPADKNAQWHGFRPALGGGEEQVRLEPGDVVIAHQKLPHRISPNRSPHIRYQVYFRLSSRQHRADGPLGELWDGFAGLHARGGVDQCEVD